MQGLVARFERRLLGELVWRLSCAPRRGAPAPLPYHRFRRGERVLVSEQGPGAAQLSGGSGLADELLMGTVEDVGRQYISVAFSLEAHGHLQSQPRGTG